MTHLVKKGEKIMKIECSWSNCQYNSFSISEEMKNEKGNI